MEDMGCVLWVASAIGGLTAIIWRICKNTAAVKNGEQAAALLKVVLQLACR